MNAINLSAVLWVGLGGALGSIGRYGMGNFVMHASGLAQSGRFPLGTLLINLLGCLLIGVLASVFQRLDCLGTQTRLFLITGCLGGFTTFSAFGLETVQLLQRQEWVMAGLYVGSSVVFGLLAVWLGMQFVLLCWLHS